MHIFFHSCAVSYPSCRLLYEKHTRTHTKDSRIHIQSDTRRQYIPVYSIRGMNKAIIRPTQKPQGVLTEEEHLPLAVGGNLLPLQTPPSAPLTHSLPSPQILDIPELVLNDQEKKLSTKKEGTCIPGPNTSLVNVIAVSTSAMQRD